MDKKELKKSKLRKMLGLNKLKQETISKERSPKKIQLDKNEQRRIQLEAAEFRWINEQLYTNPSDQAVQLFKESPQSFQTYHKGFRNQVQKWPENPVNVIAGKLSTKKSLKIADLGCGEAALALSLPQHSVHSYDLVAANERVIACDISNVPLDDSSMDVVVFSLSLMGTNFVSFLLEANRILKPKGILHIAEVESRFVCIEDFEKCLQTIGFDLLTKDTSNKMFTLFELTKSRDSSLITKKEIRSLVSKGPELLKACKYKRR